MTKPAVTLYLHVHQPYRVRPYSVFETAQAHDYFNQPIYDDPTNNEAVFKKVAEKSYRPMNRLLEQLLEQHENFRFSLSITGTFIEQAEMWAPDVLESFKRLVATGRVELLAETYYHSLAFFYDREEFVRQVNRHQQKLHELFGVTPSVFRNTELAYNDELAAWAESSGYKGVLAEGWDSVLEWRSPNYVYRPTGTSQIGLLLKNYHLSDDIAFRFSNRGWSEWPLTAEKFTNWVDSAADKGPLVNLFMDYETFGEHQWADTGIFDFFEQFVGAWLTQHAHGFVTVSDALERYEPVGELSMPQTVTWADTERDLSAWTGNSMQREAIKHLYDLADAVLSSNDEQLIHDWRLLQASDLFYYMSTKWLQDGDVHTYFSPYESPYDAFVYYINVVRDLRWRLMEHHNIGRLHG